MKCSICDSTNIRSLGTVPFDRNNNNVPIINNTPMEYVQCSNCNFICCPEMLFWTPADLGEKVYNAEYIKYDPDYVEIRPKNYAEFFRDLPTISAKGIKHLDYGSGSGIMSLELRKYRWDSSCYDPYTGDARPSGKFNFITAIEVFEHSLNINDTISDIKKLLDVERGVVCFSTQLAEPNTSIDWWYIAARNGHISILSQKSLKIIATNHGMFFSSINSNVHLLQSKRSNYKGIFGRK